MKLHVSMIVNSEDYEVEVEPRKVLLTVLRDYLGLIGTKEGVRDRRLRGVHGHYERPDGQSVSCVRS